MLCCPCCAFRQFVGESQSFASDNVIFVRWILLSFLRSAWERRRRTLCVPINSSRDAERQKENHSHAERRNEDDFQAHTKRDHPKVVPAYSLLMSESQKRVVYAAPFSTAAALAAGSAVGASVRTKMTRTGRSADAGLPEDSKLEG